MYFINILSWAEIDLFIFVVIDRHNVENEAFSILRAILDITALTDRIITFTGIENLCIRSRNNPEYILIKNITPLNNFFWKFPLKG